MAMPDNLIDFTPSAYRYPLLIKHLLHAPLVRYPDREIVYRDLRRHTYREFRERIGQLATALSGIGVKAGDVVAVLDWDSHRYLECYFAVPMMGAVLQTVNLSLPPEQLIYTLNDAGAQVVLVNSDFLPLLDKVGDKLQTVRKFVLLHDGKELPPTRLPVAGEYERLLRSSSPFFQFPDFDENTRATTFHTTGTTGRPKGVYFSHRQLVLHAMAIAMEYGLSPAQGRTHRDDVYMPLTPMFHVHAWGAPYSWTTAGMKQVYPGRYAPDMLLKLIKKEGVTSTHCVPTILQMLLTAPGSKEVDLSHLRMVIGGSALPRALARAAMDRGIDVFAGYGLSEACPFLTTAHLKSEHLTADENEVGFRTQAGLPGPFVDLRIVDTGMDEVPHDGKTTGEIVVRAPWLTMGYLNNREASEQLWAGGYLHTGDIGTIDANGYVHVTDRLKDIIKSGGEWISSIDLEDIILEEKGIARAAVIAVKDEKWGERPLALLVRQADFAGKIDAEDVRSHLAAYVKKGALSKFAIPEPQRIFFVEALPLTSVGKIDKKKLRETYQHELAYAGAAPTKEGGPTR
jgi:fatty-acyl-CoA synthase